MFHSLAEQYVGASDRESQEKLLTVLSNTSTPVESRRIMQSLVELAVVEQTNVNTKLRTLNLVDPGRLQQPERDQVSRQLSQLIDQEAARIVPEIIRFSKKEQRPKIARNMLSRANSEFVRGAILDDISTGAISTTDDLKAVLLEIATDSDDALSRDAAATLKYAFELDQPEYARLNAYK